MAIATRYPFLSTPWAMAAYRFRNSKIKFPNQKKHDMFADTDKLKIASQFFAENRVWSPNV
jgi:hypothetical protein